MNIFIRFNVNTFINDNNNNGSKEFLKSSTGIMLITLDHVNGVVCYFIRRFNASCNFLITQCFSCHGISVARFGFLKHDGRNSTGQSQTATIRISSLQCVHDISHTLNTKRIMISNSPLRRFAHTASSRKPTTTKERFNQKTRNNSVHHITC